MPRSRHALHFQRPSYFVFGPPGTLKGSSSTRAKSGQYSPEELLRPDERYLTSGSSHLWLRYTLDEKLRSRILKSRMYNLPPFSALNAGYNIWVPM